MITYYFQIIFLALIQGVSEFIPVSSSAHLFLISNIGKISIQSLEIDISLHLGSLLAILIYFRNELINIFKNKKILNLILFGSMPIIIVGFILYNFELIYQLRNLKLIASTTLIFGILLYFVDKRPISNNINQNLNFKNIIAFGIFQILSLIPGVSRSGVVITACRIYKFNRIDAAKISFYLSIPALTGASILGLNNALEENIEINLPIILSTFFSFIFSYLTIRFLIFYLKSFSLNLFVYYRILLALALFLIAYR